MTGPGGANDGTDPHFDAAEAQRWLDEGGRALAELLVGESRNDEGVFQDWLEHHPAFVPGARGPGGNTGHNPWPAALISQPRLPAINGNVPDFCWLAADSAELTATFIEIETPAKRWQQERKAVQSAELTQALEQINSWRAWFNRPHNQSAFLDEYLVPDYLSRLQFSQRYILVHGSRSEYAGDDERIRQRASTIRGDDYEGMSFDRLLELATTWAASFGCVRREDSGFRAIAVPSIWSLSGLSDNALRLTAGLEEAVEKSGMPDERRETVLAELADLQADEPPRFFP